MEKVTNSYFTTSSEQCHFLNIVLMVSIDILDFRGSSLQVTVLHIHYNKWGGGVQSGFVTRLILLIFSSFRQTSDRYTFLHDALTVYRNQNYSTANEKVITVPKHGITPAVRNRKPGLMTAFNTNKIYSALFHNFLISHEHS